jgi:hypothetical protein
MKLSLSSILFPKKFLLYAVGAFAAGAIVIAGYDYFATTPPPLKPATPPRTPIVPAVAPAPTESPQVVQVAAAADKVPAAQQSTSKVQVTPSTSTGDVQKGKEVFSLQERKEKAELELTISKVENDIKKEKIRDQYLNKYPELAFAGEAAFQLNKKADEQKKGGEIANLDAAKAGVAEDSLDKVKFLGIVGSRAVWDVGNGRTTTGEGEAVHGYLVTHVGPDKVTIMKNGRTVTYTP